MKKKIKNNDLLFAVCLNVLFLLVALFIFRPFFEENDDSHLAMIAEGVYGERQTHLIYINIIIGYVYKALLTVFPMIRWHCVLQYLFIFVGLTGVTYVLCHRNHGRVLATVFVSACFYELYVSLQYTKTAAFIASAGYVLIFEYIKRAEDRERKLLVVGTLLLVYSFMLRDSAFILVSPFWGLAALYEIVKEKNIKSFIRAFIPAFAVIAVCYLVNYSVYANDSEWKNFLEYNEARTQATDYRYDLFDYNTHSEFLDERDVSENDALLLLTYQFGDDRVMNAAWFEKVVNEGSARAIDIDLVKAFCKNIYDTFAVLSAVVVLLITVLVVNAFMKEKFPLWIILCMAAGFCYFQYSGRWSHRLVYAVLLAVVALLVYKMSDIGGEPGGELENRASGALAVGALLIVFITVGSLAGNWFSYNKFMRTDDDFRAELEYMRQNKDMLYAIDTFTFQDRCKYDVFAAMEPGSLDNIVACGTWFVNSPVTKSVCRAYGYDNPFEALESGSGSVILVDNIYPDQKALFLSEHSGDTYTAQYLETVNGYKNYRMVRESSD